MNAKPLLDVWVANIFSHSLSVFHFPDDVRHTKVSNFDEVQFIYSLLLFLACHHNKKSIAKFIFMKVYYRFLLRVLQF